MRELSPLEQFEKAYRRWWWLAVMILIGGLVGWFFRYLLPPVYEAQATMVVDIDYQQTGPIEELEQDQLIFAVTSLFYSPEILNSVTQAVSSDYPGFKVLVPLKNAAIERRRADLFLTIKSDNPEAAAMAANLWADQALQALQQAHQNAVDAKALRDYLGALNTCPTPPVDAGLSGFCGQFTPEQLQSEVTSASQLIEQETQASAGIVPAIGYELVDHAAVPRAPVSRNRWLMMMGGALIGFVVGAVLSMTWPTGKGHSIE